MTQLAPRTESFGAGDQSWLGSRHGTDVAKTVTLAPAAWSAKIVDGRIKSGEPYAMKAGLAVPYASGASDGTEVIAGFLLTDQSVDAARGNIAAPGVWHGRIILSKLPSTVAASAKQSGQFLLEA
ncbi:potassium transporter [Gordonia malaquae]|uniref:potassium transporter n=1 Tax=Gordonia malaquae TaxID=410332 RepID=UPI00301B2073